MKQQVTIYEWQSVGFPLYREPRPGFNFFDYVDEVLKEEGADPQRLPVDEKHDGWLTWVFISGISEEVRVKLQKKFDEYYGESSNDFRWQGVRSTVSMVTTIALGRHLQHLVTP